MAALFALFVAVEHLRGKLALAGRLKELRAKGDILDYRELIPPRPAADKNAVPLLLQMTNQIAGLSNVVRTLIPSMVPVAPGRALASWQLKQWPGDGKKTNSWADLEADLPRLKILAKQVHEAVQRPSFDMGFNYQNGFVKFELLPILPVKNAARCLATAVSESLRQGRTDEAVAGLCDLIRLVAMQSEEPLIISQLIRISCADMAVRRTWELLQTGAANDAQLAAVQAAWQPMDFARDMVRAHEMERALSLDFYVQLRQSRAARAEQLDQWSKIAEMGVTDLVQEPSWRMEYVHLPLWVAAWSEQDSLRALDRWQELIAIGRLAQAKSWSEAKTLPEAADTSDGWMFSPFGGASGHSRQNAYDRARFLFSGQTFAMNSKSSLRALRFDTLRQMTLAALALKRYELRHVRPAPDLTVLVPDFLAAVPTDRMDGQPLRYRLLAGNTFLLYSVGEDGKDDGGDASPLPDQEHSKAFWDRRDAVWPALATPDEVRLFEGNRTK